MKKSSRKHVSVFIASPEDHTVERKWFRTAVSRLNVEFADRGDVLFEPLGWDGAQAPTGRSAVNEEIDRCDIFVMVMHRSWGHDAPDAAPYSSYTEEEFHRALERRRREGAPEIFVLFKRVNAAQVADAGPHLKRVLEFRCRLEESRQIMYRYIDEDKKSFIDEIGLYLRAYAKGGAGSIDRTRNVVALPLPAIEAVRKAKELASVQARLTEGTGRETEAARLRAESLQMQAAEDAANLAEQGLLELARQKIVRLVSDTENIHVLYLAYEFFLRTGDSATALDVLERWTASSHLDIGSFEAAARGINRNGHMTRAYLNRAEEMYRKSLELNEVLGRKEGVAKYYGNLGTLYKIRGDFARAEEMCGKALAINEEMGRKEGMAKQYGNLGILYKTKGDFDKAEEMYRKSLSINEELGRKEGLAKQYANLGILYGAKGNFDLGEKMYRRALAINEALGLKEVVAKHYGNLGILYKTKGDLDQAEEMYQKSLELYKTLHSPNSEIVHHVNQLLVNLQMGI